MIRKLRAFVRYARQYGVINTVIYSLFKLSPRGFVLLTRQISATGTVVSPAITGLDFASLEETVFDYKTWEAFGGSAVAPVSSSRVPTFIWFVPDWLNVWGGGHFTLFRFAQHFAKRGSRNIIYIYNNQRHSSPNYLQNELNNAFIGCQIEVVVDPKLLPKADAAIATTWQSAYHVRAFDHAANKFYFMQDYEGLFYAYGTASMQANATYGFGFVGITGGTWLKSCYEAHGGKAENYRFAADKLIFYPANIPALAREKVKRVFFYGRPSTERRCFELGMVALARIAAEFPDVEIIIAGLDLSQKPPFPATLLGNMTLAKTGDLYRTCDIGIAFSATNLSYLPVELMQSGVPVISNNGPHVEWHCKHLENAYLADPVPEAVCEAFRTLYYDRTLRQKLIDGGLATMQELDWESEMSRKFDYVVENLAKK